MYKKIIILLLTSFLAQPVLSFSHSNKPKLISYTDIGHGKPLVLIHAFPTDKRLWQPQNKKLKKYFRVITLDLWGFGQSESVDGHAITMSEYADEIKQLLNQLHIHNAIIGGESMGGYIALAFYKKYPKQTSGLILSNTQSIADSADTKTKRENTALEVLNQGTAQLIKGFIKNALSKQVSVKTKNDLYQILIDQNPKALASALRGMSLRDDTSALLSNSKLPILIITSDHDRVIPSIQSENMKKLAKNSYLVVISHAGHLSNLEQPKQWNQAVIDIFYDQFDNASQ